jgi:hypothetical protein
MRRKREDKFSPAFSSEEIQIQTARQLFYLQSSLLYGTEGGSLETEQSVNKSVATTLVKKNQQQKTSYKMRSE